MAEEMGSFENDTLYRMCVEAARYWVIEHFLRTGELPDQMKRWVYPSGPVAALDWGNAPGMDDKGQDKILRYKRIEVTLKIVAAG